MRNQLVYDLPLRLFHWIFATLFITAFLIAKTIDDESSVFSYHMLAGLLLGFVVSLRLIWGFWGTKHSRFSGFALSPKELISYFMGLISGDKRKWSGHNPASSWAGIVMFALALGLGMTGYQMATGQKEALENVHELLANGFLVIVLMHIAGVITHSLRHRDGIALSMLDGAKQGPPAADTIGTTRPLIAVVFLFLVATFAAYLINNFDSTRRTLNLLGTQLQLGEAEEDEGTEQVQTDDHDETDEEKDDD